jgi:hypothetical protein
MSEAIVATEIDESLEAGIGKALHALKPSGVAFRQEAFSHSTAGKRPGVAGLDGPTVAKPA